MTSKTIGEQTRGWPTRWERLLLLGQRARGWLQPWGPFLLKSAVVAVVLFGFWLVADQEVLAIHSPHDDEWFMLRARDGYWFGDERYSHMTFIKEPIFP